MNFRFLPWSECSLSPSSVGHRSIGWSVALSLYYSGSYPVASRVIISSNEIKQTIFWLRGSGSDRCVCLWIGERCNGNILIAIPTYMHHVLLPLPEWCILPTFHVYQAIWMRSHRSMSNTRNIFVHFLFRWFYAIVSHSSHTLRLLYRIMFTMFTQTLNVAVRCGDAVKLINSCELFSIFIVFFWLLLLVMIDRVHVAQKDKIRFVKMIRWRRTWRATMTKWRRRWSSIYR